MAVCNPTPPPDELRSMIYYHEGEIYWFPEYRKGPRKTDKPIGSLDKEGYKRTSFTLDGVKRDYKIHRLVYWLITGEWVNMIDHLDRNKSNNQFSNLEPTDNVDNGRNRSVNINSDTGYIGVNKAKNGYRISITLDGKPTYFYGYKRKETAALARDVLARILYGDKAQLNVLDKEIRITNPA
ncbi:hypothetical protein CDG24_25175 [Salmonella enterica subsp. enterica serovar Newport]|nr:hypothetical protein [Salmonella enterica subsp. enterica serovar Newport]